MDLTKTNAGGLRRELGAAGVNMGAMVTLDNWQILLSQAHLLQIANATSSKLGRKLNAGEADSLVSYIRDMPAAAVANMPVGAAINLIANGWMAARESRRNKPADLPPTTPNDLEEYQRREIGQRSPSESIYKWQAFADRRGNAEIDHDRVIGNHSSPHDIAPLETNAVQRVTYEAMKAIHEIVEPNAWQRTINTFREGYRNTFLDVQLPRQTVALDSRNSKQNYTAPGEFQWLIHNAGQVGAIGDVRIQDTIQQIVAMQVQPFYIPVAAGTPAASYGKIRLLIKEFASQSITVAQFASPTSRELYNSNFHFEFDMGPITGGRCLLTPAGESTYVFRLPLAIVDVITLQFRSPFELLTLPSGYADMALTPGNPTILTSAAGETHGIATGDLIYVLNSASGSAAIDRELTSQSGYIVTVVNPTTLTIPVNTAATAAQTVQVYYASKRVFLNIRFTSIEQ